MLKFKKDEITYSKCGLEQRMTLAKISIHCMLKHLTIFTGKQLRWSLFSMNLKAFKPVALFKIHFSTGVFETFKNIYFEENL